MQELKKHIAHKAHVIWDWNGTLLADLQHTVNVANVLMQEEGLGVTTVDEYRKIFCFPVIEYYKVLGFDTSPANFARLCERFNELFHAGLSGCDLWPGARELLADVKGMGKLQSVLSASEHHMLNYSLKLYGVEHFFDHIQGVADKLARSKVEFGHKLMERAGVAPAECVLIGDTDHDLEVADALGIDMILVEHGHQCPTRLREVHHTVVKVF